MLAIGSHIYDKPVKGLDSLLAEDVVDPVIDCETNFFVQAGDAAICRTDPHFKAIRFETTIRPCVLKRNAYHFDLNLRFEQKLNQINQLRNFLTAGTADAVIVSKKGKIKIRKNK